MDIKLGTAQNNLGPPLGVPTPTLGIKLCPGSSIGRVLALEAQGLRFKSGKLKLKAYEPRTLRVTSDISGVSIKRPPPARAVVHSSALRRTAVTSIVEIADLQAHNESHLEALPQTRLLKSTDTHTHTQSEFENMTNDHHFQWLKTSQRVT